MEKTRHPLASVKEALEKNSPLNTKSYIPIPKEKIALEVAPSNAFEKMGVLLLAGGQGTRLGFDGPKGCFELPLKEKKSLFQIHLEKIREKGANLSVAIMTSPLNHAATQDYLQSNHWFGLNPNQIDLFQQELVPMCDDQGNVFFKTESRVAQAPAGNGKALFHFYHSPIWKKWKEKKIEYVQVLPIDNPLAEPFDGKLLTCHLASQFDIVLKCIKRDDPEERIGVVVSKEEQLMVCEYSEVSKEIKTDFTRNQLTYFLGNSGIFSCSMHFIEQVERASLVMPWHLVRKKASQMVSTSNGLKIKSVWIWKFETFIFDLFPYARSFQVILEDRKKCFAPLKNLTGSNTPENVAKAYQLSLKLT